VTASRPPDLVLEQLDQTYRRTGARRYRYGAAAYGYAAELELISVGFVTDYPGSWALGAERSNRTSRGLRPIHFRHTPPTGFVVRGLAGKSPANPGHKMAVRKGRAFLQILVI